MKRRLQVAILGAGGFAREVLWAIRTGHVHATGDTVEPVAFVDRTPAAAPLHGLPVTTLDQLPRDVALVCGIGGMTEIKQRVVEAAAAEGFRFAPAIVADGVRLGPNVALGEGTIICAGNILTVDIAVGRHVAINLDCTVGHDCVLGDYATLSPGCHVSGHVTFGSGVYAGTGCSIVEGLEVGDWSVIGAGAVVTKPVPALALVVGVPAEVKKLPRTFKGAIPASVADAALLGVSP